jgi:hypothetical protein
MRGLGCAGEESCAIKEVCKCGAEEVSRKGVFVDVGAQALVHWLLFLVC